MHRLKSIDELLLLALISASWPTIPTSDIGATFPMVALKNSAHDGRYVNHIFDNEEKNSEE